MTGRNTLKTVNEELARGELILMTVAPGRPILLHPGRYLQSFSRTHRFSPPAPNSRIRIRFFTGTVAANKHFEVCDGTV
jgi:hypothetical protein